MSCKAVQCSPLASRMRPKNLSEIVGQVHLLGANKPISQVVCCGHLHSMILWGPPGTGKTTLAQILSQQISAEFVTVSAVLCGVKEIRDIVAHALQKKQRGLTTVLFVDEVHRFNKSQQDIFLPHVERGDFILIGATTENPSFQLNNALLSRTRVYMLNPLTIDELLQVLKRALQDKVNGLGSLSLHIAEKLLIQLAQCADGDARSALNLLEVASDFAQMKGSVNAVSAASISEILKTSMRRFDRQGDMFYDLISALHKAIRGSDPDSALYWFARMVDGGCDLNYIVRRVIRIASEDIGVADPRALGVALDAAQAYERLGSPEGELALAQAVVYCSVAAKSNSVYTAYSAAMRDVKNFGSLEVPLHLRNAPTHLLKQIGAGKGYRYAHNEAEGFVAGEHYLPPVLQEKRYYFPVERGLEIQIKKKFEHLRSLNLQSRNKEPTK